MNLNIRTWLREHYRPQPNLLFLLEDASGTSMRIIRDMEAKSLTIFDVCCFAEVLEQPLSLAWGEIPVYTELALQLLQTLSRKKPLTRNEGTWLAFQIAYLKSMKEVLSVEIQRQKLWLERAMFKDMGVMGIGLEPPVGLESARLIALLKTLYPVKLTDTQAEQALDAVADSLLAQQMQNATIAWLIANGTEEMEAKLITRRIAIALPGHLLAVVAENAAALAQLQKFLRLGNIHPQAMNNYTANGLAKTKRQEAKSPAVVGDWIDLPREIYRSKLMRDIALPLFGEFFALPDIYVPPKGLSVGDNLLGDRHDSAALKPLDLQTWLLDQLEDYHTITWIEGESGCGKTSFVRMFAVHLAHHVYPNWMPIVVRLRDIRLGNDFLKTVCSGFTQTIGEYVNTWLELEHSRCVLILDGLEELPSKEQQVFIAQLLQFHTHSLHKIIITARTQEYEQLEQGSNLLPLRRIQIQPFFQDEWRQWFQNWAKVQSLNVAQSFFGFLKSAGAFTTETAGQCLLPELTTFASQPLMLYLLAVLHRDGLLDGMLLRTAESTIKYRSGFFLWELFSRLQRWVLGYPYSGGVKTILMREGMAHIHRTPDAIAKLYQPTKYQSTQNQSPPIQPRQLNDFIQELALQNWRSQRHLITQEPEFPLPAFLFQAPPTNSHQLEFTHPYLEKFIAAFAIARELVNSIDSQQNPNEYAEFIYSLLGGNIFDTEFQELIVETLRREAVRHGTLATLREKLVNFWYEYQRSTWLDMGIIHVVLTQYQDLGNPTNIEAINACTGINVFFLLSILHQETKTMFFPGGIPNTSDFNPHAIAQLIARTNILGAHIFSDRTYPNSLIAVDLSHTNFTGTLLGFAHLNEVNLSNANLANINLSGANLTGADLTNANLSGANLMGANLSETNLIGANLTGANLTDTVLDNTNLTNACLCDAVLNQRDREKARLLGAIFSVEDFHAIKRLLSQHELSSYAAQYENHTSMWMSHISGIGSIETSEGEILSEEYGDAEDETFVNGYQQEV